MRCSFNGVNLNLNCVDGGLVKNKTKTKDGGYAGGVYAGDAVFVKYAGGRDISGGVAATAVVTSAT